MSEMVEKVAEAIADAMNMNRAGRLETEAAIAAIQAMREPSAEMCDAGAAADGVLIIDAYEAHDGDSVQCEADVVFKPARCWRAMIDAMIGE